MARRRPPPQLAGLLLAPPPPRCSCYTCLVDCHSRLLLLLLLSIIIQLLLLLLLMLLLLSSNQGRHLGHDTFALHALRFTKVTVFGQDRRAAATATAANGVKGRCQSPSLPVT